MKHPSTYQLFEYWNERRGQRLLPRRDDIEPEAIRSVLADTFILSFEPSFGYPVRVAGTRVCALFGREIKGEAFLDVFCTHSRLEVTDLICCMAEESVGVVASAHEQACDARTGSFELLLLPLSLAAARMARVLGALVPADLGAWQQRRRLADLVLGSYRFVGLRSPALISDSLRQRPIIRRFVVYEGGQTRIPS
ncbi:MAG TPA: PAS domain-containing protein [Xanthobacteraceae bacterium]